MSSAGLLSYDFTHVFPHLAWVSEWSTDAQYPDGYQYKLLSARREPEDTVTFVLILQRRSGDKEVMHTATVPAARFGRIAAIYTDGLSAEHGVAFEAQDFTACRDFASFDAAATRYGWPSSRTPDAG